MKLSELFEAGDPNTLSIEAIADKAIATIEEWIPANAGYGHLADLSSEQLDEVIREHIGDFIDKYYSLPNQKSFIDANLDDIIDLIAQDASA